MTADLVLGVLQVSIEAIKGLSKLITRKLEHDKVGEGLEESVKELTDSVSLFHSLQQGAGIKQDEREGSTLQEWLKQLKEILYDAEDLLDEYATDISIQEVERGRSDWKGKVIKAFTPRIIDRDVKFAKKIRHVAHALKVHSEKRASLGLQVVEREKMDWGWRETTPIGESERYPMVGRDEEVKRIKQAILRGCGLEKKEKVGETSSSIKDPNPLTILPIVGMGGMGKTTLARTIMNDDEMKQFDWRVWVCVSDDFDKSSILKKIIDYIYNLDERNGPCKWTALPQLEDELLKLVKGKRFLLVLDDIWNDEKGSWDSLLNTLEAAACNTNGCALLITSRIISIKEAMHHPGCREPVHLKGMEEVQLWQIFKKYAFRDIPKDLKGFQREDLESIGKDIAKRLKGSPLAAKSVGTLLSSDYSTKHWNDVAENDLWELKQDKSDNIPILRMSYQYLSAELKQCLVLLSLYLKDHQFCEYEVFQLWMAHSLIPNEDVGERNLKHLVSRSFLEHNDGKYCSKHIFCYGWNCDGKQYSMHDLIHDLLLVVSKHDCHLLDERVTEKHEKLRTLMMSWSPNLRHVSFVVSEQQRVDRVYDLVRKHEKLRTLMISHPPDSARWFQSLDLPKQLTCLRVLAINHVTEINLAKSICNLKHLRFLDLSHNCIVKLPKSIWRLHNLQVLDLSNTERSRVPSTVTRLVNLRYFFCDEPVKEIGKLTSLRASGMFCIEDESGFGIGELKNLNELRGSLRIRNLELVRSKEEAEQAHLRGKKHLKELNLECHRLSGQEERSIDEEVLEALKPCQSLEKIMLYNYLCAKLPSWFNDAWLRSLTYICLEGCRGLETLPPSLGTMPFLKTLILDRMWSLKEMRWQLKQEQLLGDSSSSSPSSVVLFPELEYLWLWHIPNWDGRWVLPQLKELQLCPKLKKLQIFDVGRSELNLFDLSALLSLQHVEIGSCNQLSSLGDLSPLTLLRSLQLYDCPKLDDLPGINHLTSLQWLTIESCEKLQRKYEERKDENGNDMNPFRKDISHIPNLRWKRHFYL